MIEVYESRNGAHWTDTRRHRPLKVMTRGDIFWFLLGHVLLLPLTLIVLALSFLSLPLYLLWARSLKNKPLELDVHGEVCRITADSHVNQVFEKSLREDMAPDVSVVIPFYNRSEWVDRVIRSVLRQNLPEGMTAEIIAVDNGSTDDTVSQLKQYPIRVVECQERGPGAARMQVSRLLVRP